MTFVYRARALVDVGAYVHWYFKYGISSVDILRSCDILTSIAKEYEDIDASD
jgi:hypothetical protein